jgi:hypothetical protein
MESSRELLAEYRKTLKVLETESRLVLPMDEATRIHHYLTRRISDLEAVVNSANLTSICE